MEPTERRDCPNGCGHNWYEFVGVKYSNPNYCGECNTGRDPRDQHEIDIMVAHGIKEPELKPLSNITYGT